MSAVPKTTAISEAASRTMSKKIIPLTPPSGRPCLLLIHGWGMSYEVMQPWYETLANTFDVYGAVLPGYPVSADDIASESLTGLYQDMSAVYDCWQRDLPSPCLVVGWSMGGNLALDWLNYLQQQQQKQQASPQQASDPNEAILGVVLLACNPCFVASEPWPGMAPAEFDGFYQGIVDHPAKTLKRFRSLQTQGAADARALLRSLPKPGGVADVVLAQSLAWLGAYDGRHCWQSSPWPMLAILGANDALVPSVLEKSLTSSDSCAARTVQVIDDAGHLPFLSHATAVSQRLQAFWQELPTVSDVSSSASASSVPVDSAVASATALTTASTAAEQEYLTAKQAVAASFSRAAATYDAAAGIQRTICDQTLRWLAEHTQQTTGSQLVVDLGCGTGYATAGLQQYGQQWLGLDLAEGMLSYAASHAVNADQWCWLAGDAERLPLADGQVDILFSSLAIQWCDDLTALMAEVSRVLAPGGVFVFSTLGPQTLHELRQAWASVDDYVHVNRFAQLAQLQTAAEQAGLMSTWQRQKHVFEYNEVRQITRELKAIGAHNVTAGRPRGLTGRRKIQAMIAAYEAQRNADGKLPASYDVILGRVSKPVNESASG